MKILQQTLLPTLAPLLAVALLACEDLLSPQTSCYYDDSGFVFVQVQCTTTKLGAPWKLCGQTETEDDCKAWLRREGIAL